MSHPNKLIITGTPLVGGMDLSIKLGIIRTYARMHKTSPDEISALTDDIKTAFNKRNEFAHSVVRPQKNHKRIEVQSLKFNSLGNLPEPQRHTAEHIVGYAKAIHSSVRALNEKLNALGYRKMSEAL